MNFEKKGIKAKGTEGEEIRHQAPVNRNRFSRGAKGIYFSPRDTCAAWDRKQNLSTKSEILNKFKFLKSKIQNKKQHIIDKVFTKGLFQKHAQKIRS